MNDSELLELAAKAAGLRIRHNELELNGWMWVEVTEHTAREWWNPLVSDGDALRLAVSLNIHIGLETGVSCAWARWGAFFREPHGDDKRAATCRAIVRAAADIGRQKSG